MSILSWKIPIPNLDPIWKTVFHLFNYSKDILALTNMGGLLNKAFLEYMMAMEIKTLLNIALTGCTKYQVLYAQSN